MDKVIAAYFGGKPDSFAIFKAVYEQVRSFGSFDVTVKSQISFGVNRKFAWFWLYNVTQKNPNGILHMMLRVDRKIGDPHVRNIEQIGKNRWNHQVGGPHLEGCSERLVTPAPEGGLRVRQQPLSPKHRPRS